MMQLLSQRRDGHLTGAAEPLPHLNSQFISLFQLYNFFLTCATEEIKVCVRITWAQTQLYLCQLSKLNGLKQYTFIISQFLQLRSPGMAELGPLLRVSEGAIKVPAKVYYHLDAWLEKKTPPSSFRLLAEFIPLWFMEALASHWLLARGHPKVLGVACCSLPSGPFHRPFTAQQLISLKPAGELE